MNRLSTEKRVQIVSALAEGSSINSISRMTGVAKHTILKLLEDMGCACATYHHCDVRGLNGFSKKRSRITVMPWLSTSCTTTFAESTKTLRVTPAMEAGIADHVWSLEELVALPDWKTEEQAA